MKKIIVIFIMLVILLVSFLLIQQDIKDRQRYASPRGKTILLTLEPKKPYEVSVHQILLGQHGIDAGVIWEHHVREAMQQGKYVVYFDVSVTNIEGEQEKSLSYHQFKLEDNEGNSYSPEQTVDYLKGDIQRNKQGRGGVCFFVYKDNVPKRLIYDTRLLSTRSGEMLFAIGDLGNLFE